MNTFASSSSSESTPSKRARFVSKQACFVTLCEDEGGYYYNIYIVDVKSDESDSGFRQLSPTFHLNHSDFGEMAYCVFGSNIYLFPGLQDGVVGPPYEDNTIPRSVYYCDLSSIDLTQSKIILTESSPSLVNVCSWHPKRAPVAIPTPDGTKFVVFSLWIWRQSDFELFDPVTASWRTLPCLSVPNTCFWVNSYAFIDKSILFISTTIGMFQLDFESLEKGWQRQFKSFHGGRSAPVGFGLYYMIDNMLCLSPLGYHDVSRKSGLGNLFRSPVSPFDDYGEENFRDTIRFVTLINHDSEKGSCEYAILRILNQMDENGMHPRMILDVFESDIKKYKEDKLMDSHALLTTKKVMSVKFVDQTYFTFTAFCVYFLKD